MIATISGLLSLVVSAAAVIVSIRSRRYLRASAARTAAIRAKTERTQQETREIIAQSTAPRVPWPQERGRVMRGPVCSHGYSVSRGTHPNGKPCDEAGAS